MATPRHPDASVTQDCPILGAPINLASDTDVTALFPDAYARWLYVGGTGDVKVDLYKSTGITFKAVPAGTTLRGVFTKVYSTANGTTATNLLVLD
jgi:hypothetical protein